MPTDTEQIDFITSLLAIERANDCLDLWWTAVDRLVLVYVNCNDLFYWGTADIEEITPTDLPLVAQAIADTRATQQIWYADSLYAARRRKMRPQRPCYKNMNEATAALFDVCGPERTPEEEG